MLKRSRVAALMLAASQLATARNASSHWDEDEARKKKQKGTQQSADDSEFVKFEDFAESIAFWGYSWEPYEATTRDGFKLTLFRITGGPPEGFVKPELPTSSSSDEDEVVDPE